MSAEPQQPVREAVPDGAVDQEFDKPPVRRPAPADRPIHDLLAARWSPRAITPDRSVPKESVLRLLEAARWAPSSSNEQPWRYLVFDDEVPEERRRARECLNPGNAWAHSASVLLLSVVQTVWLNHPTKEGPNRVALHDVGAATFSMALQAVEEGLVLHQMAGFDVVKTRETFEIPDAYDPVAFIAVGFPGNVADLPEKDRVREGKARRRRPLPESVFHGAWERGIEL